MSGDRGDFSPPHVHDEAPLDTPRPVLARFYAQQLRGAAPRYRACPGGPLDRFRLDEECGRHLLLAHKQGLIPAARRELIDIIEWHSGTDPERLPEGQAVRYKRHPANLINDVCGGHLMFGVFRGQDERGAAVFDDQRVGGGLMPRMVPGFLDLPFSERRAVTCEALAGLIEDDADKDDASAYVPAKMLLKAETPYDNHKAIRKALDANPWIRHFAPRPQRLMVHGADWLKFLAEEPPDPLDVPPAVVEAAVLESQRIQAEILQTKGKK
jgi:hypothetical protein